MLLTTEHILLLASQSVYAWSLVHDSLVFLVTTQLIYRNLKKKNVLHDMYRKSNAIELVHQKNDQHIM